MKCISTVLLLLIIMASCSNNDNPIDAGDDDDDGIEEEIIPTTVVQGPGGPAYLRGLLARDIFGGIPEPDIEMTVLAEDDYSDTLVSFHINSTDKSFLVTDMPLDTVDIIFKGEGYFARKLPLRPLVSETNSFLAIFPSGFFIDSTIFVLSVADSFTTETWIGYDPKTMSFSFKAGIHDSTIMTVIYDTGCDTLKTIHYPEPKPPEIKNRGDVFILKCTEELYTHIEIVEIFISLESVYNAGPSYTEVTFDY